MCVLQVFFLSLSWATNIFTLGEILFVQIFWLGTPLSCLCLSPGNIRVIKSIISQKVLTNKACLVTNLVLWSKKKLRGYKKHHNVVKLFSYLRLIFKLSLNLAESQNWEPGHISCQKRNLITSGTWSQAVPGHLCPGHKKIPGHIRMCLVTRNYLVSKHSSSGSHRWPVHQPCISRAELSSRLTFVTRYHMWPGPQFCDSARFRRNLKIN